MKYLVWDPSGESRNTATAIDAMDARAAAEEYAETAWTPEDGENMDVLVLRDGEEKPMLYSIAVDFEPSFFALEIGPAAEADEVSP